MESSPVPAARAAREGAMSAVRRCARFVIPLLCAAAVAGCQSPSGIVPMAAPTSTGRTLTWSDEFTGTLASPPNASKWSYDVGTDWGNAQLEYDTNRTVNAQLDGQGHLVISARKEAWLTSSYTSARLTTRGLFSQARGRFEARIQLPDGQGIWPAFWLLGNDYTSVGWPTCGEIDIMEHKGQEPAIIHGSMHGPGYSGGSALTSAYTLPTGAFSAGYHVFAVEWETNRVTYLVDGVPYQVITPSNLPANRKWVYDHPFFIILNLAVGGNYVGAPNAGTPFPATMVVDYVRVYQPLS